MRSLTRTMEVLATINPYVARERSVFFSYALRHLKEKSKPSLFVVENLLEIAMTDPSEHFRGIAADALLHMKEQCYPFDGVGGA